VFRRLFIPTNRFVLSATKKRKKSLRARV